MAEGMEAVAQIRGLIELEESQATEIYSIQEAQQAEQEATIPCPSQISLEQDYQCLIVA